MTESSIYNCSILYVIVTSICTTFVLKIELIHCYIYAEIRIFSIIQKSADAEKFYYFIHMFSFPNILYLQLATYNKLFEQVPKYEGVL